MPETRAVTLANIASSDAFSVDNANDRVGIGSTVPDATLDIKNTVIVDGVAGVVTAIAFDGDGSRLTGVANTDVIVSSATTTGRLVVNNDATVSGVTTAGGVILKDTNIVAGVVTGSTFVGDGSGLTGVANTDVVHTREITASGVSTFSGTINAQAISGTSGAFTGNIDLNSDTNKLKLGAGDDFQLYHNGSNNFIETNNGDINITTTGDDINITAADDMTLAVQGGENAVVAFGNGPVELYYDNTERFQTNTDGVEVTHVATANTMRMFVGGSVGVGIGVTTTTGRKAVGAAGTVKGQIVYNETDQVVELYTGNSWVGIATKGISASGGVKIEDGDTIYHVFNSDSTSNFSVTEGNITGAKVLIVGGGGASGNDNGCAGGAGGIAYGSNMPFTPGTYPVRVGVGGSANENRDNDIECNGQPSRLTCPVGVVTGFGGQGTSTQVGNPYVLYETWGSDWIMNPYGDSPAITPNVLFGSGASGRITNPTSMEQTPTPVTTYGQPARPTFGGTIANYGGQGGPATNGGYWNCGGGGGASGTQGGNANPATPSPTRCLGGAGQPFPEFPAPVISPGIPTPFRPDFESEVGPTGLFGGGGGGSFENPGFYGNGGPGGGGDGDSGNANASGIKGTFGTGGGAGSYNGGSPGSFVPEVGGPGIIIIKYSV